MIASTKRMEGVTKGALSWGAGDLGHGRHEKPGSWRVNPQAGCARG